MFDSLWVCHFCRACLRHGANRDAVLRQSVHPSVDISDHPRVDPTVQVHNSEAL